MQKELSEFTRNIETKALKDETKKPGQKPGCCPTKMSIATILPEESLE